MPLLQYRPADRGFLILLPGEAGPEAWTRALRALPALDCDGTLGPEALAEGAAAALSVRAQRAIVAADFSLRPWFDR